MDLDTETDQLLITVDGQTVVDRSDLNLVLPTSIGATQIGGIGWGRWLPGEIDNVSLSIGTPSALADAAGNPNPAMGFNTGGYTKWNQYATAPFIDRMKGAHEWGGEFARYLEGLEPRWEEVYRSLGGSEMVQQAFSKRNAIAWRRHERWWLKCRHFYQR